MSIASEAKNLALVLATSALIIMASIEAVLAMAPATDIPTVVQDFETLNLNNFLLPLKCVSCIYYPQRFKKNQAKVQALLNFGSKFNIMTLAYRAKLGLKI